MKDLRGGKGVEMDRVPFFDVPEEVFVPLKGEFGVVAALQEDPRAAQGKRLLDLFVDGLVGEDVGLGVPLFAGKGAKGTGDSADVCVIDVAVQEITDPVLIFLSIDVIG